MGLLKEERGLAVFYPLIIGLSFICSVTSAVAYTHWKYVLDTWDRKHYGCFLYSWSSPASFTGGHVAYCYFAIYGLILPVIFAVIFGCFHIFRVCFGARQTKSRTATIHQRSGETIVVSASTEDLSDDISPYYWVPACCIAAFMAFYTLCYASLFTDGFLKSCYQYRLELTKYIHATGDLVTAIQGRLSCSAVFDFMDYIHTEGDSNLPYEFRRVDRINSASCYYLAVLSSWTAVICWIIILIVNIQFARKSRSVRV